MWTKNEHKLFLCFYWAWFKRPPFPDRQSLEWSYIKCVGKLSWHTVIHECLTSRLAFSMPRRIFTVCVRSTTEGYVLTGISLSVHTGGGGYPSPRFFPRFQVPGPFWGGTPVPGSFSGHWSQVPSGGYPILTGGYPSSGWGILPSQVRFGYRPARSGSGTLLQVPFELKCNRMSWRRLENVKS